MITFLKLMAFLSMILIVLIVGYTTTKVVDVIVDYKELELYYESIEREGAGVKRRIPYCDKELWLRITEGCNETDT